MTIVPNRLGVKFSLKQEPTLQPQDILPIFQRWIQEHTVDDMLIDVIDYKHVLEGPGIVLIADAADYAYDLGDGELGLHYIRKRSLPDDLEDALRLAFRHALVAARALEAEAPGDIVFDYGTAKISFLDRMHYRNERTVYENVREDLKEILSEIFDVTVSVSRVYDDQRAVFAIRCTADDADIDADEIIKRLEESRQVV